MNHLVKDLARALRRLEGTAGAGRIARRNARRAVVAILARVRGEVDRRYPAIRREVRARPRGTPTERLAELKKAGWVDTSLVVASIVAAAGIKIRRITVSGSVFTLVPTWADILAHKAPAKLASCRHNVQARKATLTELALKDRTAQPPIR